MSSHIARSRIAMQPLDRTLHSARGRFWASATAVLTLLIIAIDTHASGLASLPLSLAEAIGGTFFGMISALTIRTCVPDQDDRPAPPSRPSKPL